MSVSAGTCLHSLPAESSWAGMIEALAGCKGSILDKQVHGLVSPSLYVECTFGKRLFGAKACLG